MSTDEELPEDVRELTEAIQNQFGQPVLLLPRDLARAVVLRLGGLAFSAPIPNLTGTQPFMLPAPLGFFYGLASPTAQETAHMHPLQDEMYIPTGTMEVEAWVNSRSRRRTIVAKAGDVVIVPRGSIHRVETLEDITHVIKGPQVWGEAAKIVYKG
jgi:mannose-6-phosphate isomerase-like protein (cupin superfamily)